MKKMKKQKHVFICSIMHDVDENLIDCKVIKGPVKKETEDTYIVDDKGYDYWMSKSWFEKFEVIKDEYTPESCKEPIIHYYMGFVWEDGTDDCYLSYMASECQRRCKRPVIDYLTERKNEIDKSIEKLMNVKFIL